MATEMEENTPPAKKKRKRNNKRERLFEIPDAPFIHRNRVLHRHFTNRLPAFVAFDPSFAHPFAAQWLAAIEAAEVFPDDETTLDELQQLTGALQTAIQTLLVRFNELEYYVRRAFETTPEVLNEFQFSKLSSFKQNPPRWCWLLTLLKALPKPTTPPNWPWQVCPLPPCPTCWPLPTR